MTSSETSTCPVVGTMGERCQLPEHHNSPHRAVGSWGVVTWESAYVGDLRRELQDGAWRWRGLLADVLDDIGQNVHSEAIDAAREALAKEATHV